MRLHVAAQTSQCTSKGNAICYVLTDDPSHTIIQSSEVCFKPAGAIPVRGD